MLVCDDDTDIRRLVCTYLQLEGFRVAEARDGVEGVEQAVQVRPDLILLDVMMPNKSGTEALADIRRDFRTAFTPVVFLTAKALVGDKVGHLLSGADDYIVKPFDPPELVARVEVALRRSAALRGLNPLTGLPGNIVINEAIAVRLNQGHPFACLYADLDNFKALNDHYGFSRGDEVLRLLADCILAALEQTGTKHCFAGNVGGDDFVALTPPEEAEPVARRIIEMFDEKVVDFYDPEDRERGWVEVEDRRGQIVQTPICSVSVGIVHTESRGFKTAAQVAEIAAEMKTVAKREQGSSWAVDRRRD